MDGEDEALFSGHIDEDVAMFDGTDCSPKPASNRKRPFSSLECWSQDPNIDPSGEEAMSSSDFFEEEDDDEMGHLLDSLSDSHYGLLGVTGDSSQSYDLISQFPTELLQHIFGFLPIEDLYQNVSFVCKEWKAIVDDVLTINAWTVVAVLILLSRDVPDIQKLIICLQRPSSPLKLTEVMEALYCLALLVYAMREEKILITNRVHYKLFYCLYLLENESSEFKKCSKVTSKNKPSFKLTNEQQQIINHDIQPGQVVKIMAFAGTGKTSTLIKYAEKRPGLRFLYATFNKSIANHAFNIFPKNVTCKTFHSLAFQETGKLYYQRQKINPSGLTAYTVNFVLPESQAGFVRAKLVVKTLGNFFASADCEIEVEHVPIWYKNNRGERELVPPNLQQFTVSEANQIWKRMKSLEETRELAYKMTHDVPSHLGYCIEYSHRDYMGNKIPVIVLAWSKGYQKKSKNMLCFQTLSIQDLIQNIKALQVKCHHRPQGTQ
ncbi:hypothetical protein AB205_0206120 [Aquarana catesbeiana]|uniref:F-box domain-containing protein n=1 Tax=Aquarana catesbeiana TaxID=8400 RepID=A0A2G9REL4_AQUCT|nr:hypothetical protein AB205_0206120 [Aquarana catesbeiana]